MANYLHKTNPYKHQEDCVHYLYDKKFGALFMEQGTGKSKTVIDIVSNLFVAQKIEAVLLIAPNSIHNQWQIEQVPEHTPVDYISQTWKSTRSKSYMKELNTFLQTSYSNYLKWFFVNVEAFSTDTHLQIFRDYVKKHNTAIIVDEATIIKNPSANRTFNIVYGLGNLQKSGKRIISSFPYSKYRYILTGTMVTNSPYDLWSMFEFLSPNYFGINYFAFRNRYGIERRDTIINRSGFEKSYKRPITIREINWIRNMVSQQYDISYICSESGLSETDINYIMNHPNLTAPYKNLPELKEKIREFSYIVRKDDCLDLPPKVYAKLPVEMGAEQRKIYKELEKKYAVEFANKELSVKNKLSLLLRLSQVTGGFFPYDCYEEVDEEVVNIKGVLELGKNVKIEALKRDIEETNDEKIIIFARFSAEIETLDKELRKHFPEKRIEKYYGRTSVEKRTNIKEDFKFGKIDILIGNPACAGVGLNLQRSSLVYYFSNSYSLYYREQSEDRTHRLGTTKTVVYKDIIAVNTVDEKIYRSLREKKNLLEYFRENSVQDFIIKY